MGVRRSEARDRSQAVTSGEATSARFPRRQLRLTTANGARLIRDALAAGGEIWVSGAGQSMHPTVRDGDVVLLSPVRRAVKRGDVVLVPWGSALMLHRVDAVDGDLVLTKGDARTGRDPATRRVDVIGRGIAVRGRNGLRPLMLTWRFGPSALVRFAFGELYRRLRRVTRQLRSRRQPRER